MAAHSIDHHHCVFHAEATPLVGSDARFKEELAGRVVRCGVEFAEGGAQVRLARRRQALTDNDFTHTCVVVRGTYQEREGDQQPVESSVLMVWLC